MRALLFLLGWAAYAQPTIVEVHATDVDYAGAQILLQTSTIPKNANFYVAFATNAAELEDGSITAQTPYRGANGRDFWFDQSINNAPPNSKIYIRVFISSSGIYNDTWRCRDSAITEGKLVGLTCELGVAWPYFMTTALPGPPDTSWPKGTYPQMATGGSYNYPSISNPTEGVDLFTVAGDCSDVTEKLAGAAAATQDALVMLPPGVPCKISSLPAKPKGQSRVVIRSAAGDLYLPPPGTQTRQRHYPYMARLVGRTEAINTHGWIFYGVLFESRPMIPDGDTPAIAITRTQRYNNSASIWRIELAAAHRLGEITPREVEHGLTDSDKVMLSGITQLNNICKAGPAAIERIVSPTAFTIACGANVVPSTPNTSPGRYVATSMVQRIRSAVAGSEACGGGVLVTLTPSMVSGLDTDMVVVTGGTQGLVFNRSWRATPISKSSFCLQNSNGLSGDYVPNSGYFVVDTNVRSFVRFEQGTSDMWLDRCAFVGGGFPMRIMTAVLLLSNNAGVINSRFEGIEGWQSVDPVTGDKKIYTTSYFLTTPIAIDNSYGSDQTIQNNYIEGHGILLYTQQGDGKEENHTTNVVIRGNTVYTPFRYMAGHPDNVMNLYFSQRHWLELKRAILYLIEDNTAIGGWADNLTSGWCVALTIRGAVARMPGPQEDNQIRDIVIRRNIIRNVAAGINVTNYTDGGPLNKRTKRVAFEDNLIYDIDWFANRSIPSAVAGPAKVNSPTGGGGMSLAVAHSLTVRNNLIYFPVGSGPRNLLLFRSTHTRIINNVTVHNEFNGGGIYISPGTSGLPAVSNGRISSERWASTMWAQGSPGGPDSYSEFRGNVVVPGTQNAQRYDALDPTCATSTAANCNISASEMQSRYGVSGGSYESPAVIASWAGTTPDARIAEVLWRQPSIGDFRLQRTVATSPIASASLKATDRHEVGPRFDRLQSASQAATNVRILEIGTTTATLAYESRGACYLQYGSTRIAGPANTDNPVRQISLTGLTSQTTYRWILSCPSQEFEGRFQTH